MTDNSIEARIAALKMRVEALEGMLATLSMTINTLSVTKVDAAQVEAIVASVAASKAVDYSAMDAEARGRFQSLNNLRRDA